MSPASDRTRIVSQEATYWYIRCSDEPAMMRSDRQLFYAWLKRSPENVAEILRIAELDGKMAGQRLRDRIGEFEESNVVDIGRGSTAAQYDYQPSDTVSDKVARKESSWSGWAKAAAVALFVVSSLLGYVVLDRTPDNVVETVAAQWQHVTLDDGSTVYLDARTRLKVKFTRERRFIELQHGWAVFAVAKDRLRPFTVRADSIDVTAVGTRFGVAIDNGVITTVQEGIVDVTTRGKQDGSSVRLREGQELRVRPADTLMISEGDVQAVDAKSKLQWVTGLVQLDKTTIGEIVHQFNRRQEIQADIEDPALASRQVDFAQMQVDNVDSFVEVMESEGVAVTRNGSTLTLRATPME